MRQKQGVFSLFLLSPSSRRAWIEMLIGVTDIAPVSVALLAEGVDRNVCIAFDLLLDIESPSSRRAWIEISFAITLHIRAKVALLAEGVDRNFSESGETMRKQCRPPRGDM